jgi:heme A synthase
MHSHLLALLTFSALVATVFATIARDERRERLRFGLKIFAALVLSVVLLGWLMNPLPN